MPRMQDKRVLITGGTSGIGLATALRFIEEGARVAVTGATPERLATARSVLGPDALVLQNDAGDAGAQPAIAQAVGQAFGRLDALVVNAGVAEVRPIEQWDVASFDHSFAVNLKGPFFLVQALLPIFADPASIVLIGSISAHIGMPGSTVYSATKAGLVALAANISAELLPRGIRANAISPGPVATAIFERMFTDPGQRDAAKGVLTGQVPAGRMGDAREIADAAVYFASDESRFTVGSELIVDGGMTKLKVLQ